MASKEKTALCTYRVKRGKEKEFEKLLGRHWPTLRGLGLVNAKPPLQFRGLDESKKTFFVEILTWRTPNSAEVAHHSPEVMAVWEGMGALVEERRGRPAMEFPYVSRIRATSGRS